MAEFQEVMEQFNRMCNAYAGCSSCPLCKNTGCSVDMFVNQADLVERTVMAWAEEHPEPKYPTWRDYMESMWLDSYRPGESLNSWMNTHHIPVDIAEKLGIEPKEAR